MQNLPYYIDIMLPWHLRSSMHVIEAIYFHAQNTRQIFGDIIYQRMWTYAKLALVMHAGQNTRFRQIRRFCYCAYLQNTGAIREDSLNTIS